MDDALTDILAARRVWRAARTTEDRAIALDRYYQTQRAALHVGHSAGEIIRVVYEAQRAERWP